MSTPNKQKHNPKVSIRKGKNQELMSKSCNVSPNKEKLTVGKKTVTSHMFSSKTVPIKVTIKDNSPNHWACIVPKMY